MLMQVLSGSALLGLCALLYVMCLVLTGGLILALHHRYTHLARVWHAALLIGCGVVAVVIAHTVVVWIWAASFILSGALPDMEQSLYFSLVTYTTLGYGDLTLGPDFRVFGSMAAVSGLLNFGLSTAFLVAVVARLVPANVTLK